MQGGVSLSDPPEDFAGLVEVPIGESGKPGDREILMRLASGSGANAGAENDHGRAVAEEDSVKVDLSTVDRQTATTVIGLEHFLDRHEAVGEMGAAVFAKVAHIFDGEKENGTAQD